MLIAVRKTVALGGGHGLGVALRALRSRADELTAIVTIADDGGSSGVLRAMTGIAPPGDARRCFGALIPAGSPWPELLEHRFESGPLAGHPVGNVVLAALEEQASDAESAFARAGELFGILGRVLPASCAPVSLRARTAVGSVVGQLAIAHCEEHILRIETVEEAPRSPRETVQAILDADRVVIGPGSLYTSILPVLVLPEISAALRTTRAQKLFVTNLSEDRETRGMSGDDHISALEGHGIEVDEIIAAADGELTFHATSAHVNTFPLRAGHQHDSAALGNAIESVSKHIGSELRRGA